MKGQKIKLQAIQREQVQLVQIEKILENLLSRVHESINELKVEELQIKSSIIEQLTSNLNNDDQPTTSAQAVALSQITTFDTATNDFNRQESNIKMDMNGIEDINNQVLALESLLVPMQHNRFDEEEEEEEEDE